MNTKSHWQIVREAMLERDQGKVGEPPTAEEMLAYRRGELRAEEEARVRELLIAYPELACAVAQTEVDDPKPGDPDYLTPDAIDERLAALRSELHPPAGRVRPFRVVFGSIAAAIAIVFGGLYWHAVKVAGEPQVVAVARPDQLQSLVPTGVRGPASEVRTVRGEESLLLGLSLFDRDHSAYRLAFVDDGNVRWRSDVLSRPKDDTFVLLVPPAYRKPGRHTILLYGVENGGEKVVHEYTFRIPSR